MNAQTISKISIPLLFIFLIAINFTTISQATGAYKTIVAGKHIESASNLWLTSSSTLYFTTISKDANFIEFYGISTGGNGISQVGIDPKTSNVTITSIAPLEIKYTQDGIGIVRIYTPSLGIPNIYTTPIIASSSYDEATHITTVTSTVGGALVIILWSNIPPSTIPLSYYMNQTAQLLASLFAIIGITGFLKVLENPSEWQSVVGYVIGISIIVTVGAFLLSMGF
jgi:hypothetical protein